MILKRIKSAWYFVWAVILIRISFQFLINVKSAPAPFEIATSLAMFITLFLLGLSYFGEE